MVSPYSTLSQNVSTFFYISSRKSNSWASSTSRTQNSDVDFLEQQGKTVEDWFQCRKFQCPERSPLLYQILLFWMAFLSWAIASAWRFGSSRCMVGSPTEPTYWLCRRGPRIGLLYASCPAATVGCFSAYILWNWQALLAISLEELLCTAGLIFSSWIVPLSLESLSIFL